MVGCNAKYTLIPQPSIKFFGPSKSK